MLIGVVLSVALASCYVGAAARSRVAPADEYFGRMKMSILEIGNRLRDTTIRAARGGAMADSLMHDALATEDAIRDWERKYPADPWLARDVAMLVHIYAQLQTAPAVAHRHVCLTWLQTRYGARKMLVTTERAEVATADARLRNTSLRR
jgi:hypothetical protein